MLSRKEEFLLQHPDAIECKDKYKEFFKFKNDEEILWLMKTGVYIVNYAKNISTTVIRQPKGMYCEKCLLNQWNSPYPLMYEDGEPCKFWTPCKTCKTRKSRAFAARRWTEAITMIDSKYKNTKLATFTIPNIKWKLDEVFDRELRGDSKEEMLAIIMKQTRSFEKDNKTRYKYLGKMPGVLQDVSNTIRKKLKLRLKNMRHKHKRFKSIVDGGIVCYEAPMNILPGSFEIEMNPHLHAILHTKKAYMNTPEKPFLQEDWKLGHCHIRPIDNNWIAQLEVAKYVGKDGSRRTAWGTLRKARGEIIRSSCQPNG